MKGKQQHTVMAFDPVTGKEKPYPSHAAQWREYHGKAAWLFNPWTGDGRDPYDIGSDTFGHLIVPPNEPIYASLESVEARYADLLERLGVQGHDGAVSEITKLREARGLNGA